MARPPGTSLNDTSLTGMFLPSESESRSEGRRGRIVSARRIEKEKRERERERKREREREKREREERERETERGKRGRALQLNQLYI